jgi:hypothetical protein
MNMSLTSIGAFVQTAIAVRQTQNPHPCSSDTPVARKPQADRSRRLVAVLNERFRIADDALQWMLENRKGRATTKSAGWRAAPNLTRP